MYSVMFGDDRQVGLVKEAGCNYPAENKLGTSLGIWRLLVDICHADRLAEEHAWLLAMDTQCHLLGLFPLSHGTVDMTFMDPREVFVRLCLIGAKRFVIAHNHPSGNVSASDEDIKVAARLKAAGDIIGICLEDSIIIGNNDYVSMADSGLLNF